jgi:tetratricopeptide (TPR) repeat protein
MVLQANDQETVRPGYSVGQDVFPARKPGTPSRYQVAAVCGFLLLAVAMVFGQTVCHEFINFDDDQYAYENRHVSQGLTMPGVAWAFCDRHAANWHPLTWLSLMLDCQLYGLSAGGCHLTNVLLHAAAAILLFLLLWRMTGGFWPSALVAGLFAVHPLRTESVAWVAERKDVLSGLFFVLTVGAYAGYVRRPFSLVRYLAVMFSFALGLMAKPMLVTLPLLLLLLDYWPLRRLTSAAAETPAPGNGRGGRWSLPAERVLEKVPLLLLVAASALVTLWAQAEAVLPADYYPRWWRIGNALISYVAYLGQFFYPLGLAIVYPRPGLALPLWRIFGALFLLGSITAAALIWRRRCPYLLVGWLWYLAALVPVIGLVQVGSQTMADRFTYLPQIGLAIALAWAMADGCRGFLHRRGMCSGAATLLLVVLAGCAWRQTCFWCDSKTLWTHALACTARNGVAHHALGAVLLKQRRIDEAIPHFQQAMEIAPGDAGSHFNMGIILQSRGQIEEALRQFRMAVELKPKVAEFRAALGDFLINRGQLDEAIVHLRKAVEIQPDFAVAHYHVAGALARRGRLDEAIAHYQKSLEIEPRYVAANGSLGDCFAAQGNFDEAIRHYQVVLQMNPHDVQGHIQLGNVLSRQGRPRAAEGYFRQALQREPANAEACLGLGVTLEQQGKTTEALRCYQAFLHGRPDEPDILNNRAWILATHPDPKLRNGTEAVGAAERAVKLSPGKVDFGDTLATAYAEAGRFPDALATARKALRVAEQQHNRALADALRSRIALYEAGKPYRQTLPASTRPPKPLRTKQ